MAVHVLYLREVCCCWSRRDAAVVSVLWLMSPRCTQGQLAAATARPPAHPTAASATVQQQGTPVPQPQAPALLQQGGAVPPSRHATRLLLSPRCRAPLAPLPLAPSSSVRPCQAQEGFWSGVKEVPRWVPLAGSSLLAWRGKGWALPQPCPALRTRCLLQAGGCSSRLPGAGPAASRAAGRGEAKPHPRSPPGKVERRKRRAILRRETLGYYKGSFPPRLQDHLLS